MVKNYLRIAFRNLWRHKGFSLLNIIGLTVGMVAFYLIFLYVTFELSYDNMYPKADRIYRIVADIKTPTETLHTDKPAWAVPLRKIVGASTGWIFFAAGLMASLIALITISFQAIKAAITNPIVSLRTE